ncbi:MAG: hypothetical protein ACYTFA_17995 [Planctomycetota bacterium]|jgi:hypothetical protein
MYAGTFHFRVSENAMGTFLVDIEIGSASSIMTTSQAVAIPFEAGEPATITIVTPRRPVIRVE